MRGKARFEIKRKRCDLQVLGYQTQISSSTNLIKTKEQQKLRGTFIPSDSIEEKFHLYDDIIYQDIKCHQNINSINN